VALPYLPTNALDCQANQRIRATATRTNRGCAAMKSFFGMLFWTSITTSLFSAWLSPPWYGLLGIALHFSVLYSIAYGVNYE